MNNLLPSSRRKHHPLGVVAAFALLALASPLAAQTTYTWDAGGTNTSWGTASNWVGDVVPTFNTNAILVFGTNLGANDTLFTAADRQIRGMTFGANLAATDNIVDIRTRTGLSGTAVNLLLNGAAANASITLDANTASLQRVALGQGNVGAISFQTTTDLFHNASGVVLQFDANTTGAGALNKHGVGAVTFTRANSFNGLNLYGGTVVAWNQTTAMGTNSVTLGATGSSSNVSLFLGNTNTYTNAITVSSGSGTRLIGNTDVTNQLGGFGFITAITGNAILSGGIDLAAGKDVTFAITNYVATTTDRMTVSGAVTGTGGIVKTGNGILVLSVSNSYSGTTDIQGGKFYLGGAGRLGSGAVTISNGANLDFGTGSGQTNIVSNNISGEGAIVQSTASTTTRLTGDVTSTGGLTINNGTLLIGNGGTTGSYNGSTVIDSGATLSFARSNAYTHNGTISGAGNVSKTAAGDVTMTASNSYSGATGLFTGALVAGHANALGTGNINFSTNGGGGTLRYTAASAGTDWATRIVNSTAAIRLDTDGNNVNLAGVIASNNTGGLTKSGNGTLTLGGANAYTGNTTVSAGALVLATNGSLRFVIGGSATNNRLLGSGTTLLDGQFAFDLTGAATNTNATWTIVAGTLTNSYGTNFIVTGFNGSGGLWTNTTNGVNYVFAQSNSVLSVQSTGAPTPYNAWVAYWQGVDSSFTNTAGTDNPDGDPFDNNEEFAFDGNPTVGSPALLTATMVGTNAVFNYVALTNTNAVTYAVQSTTNLAAGPWTDSAVTISNSLNQSNISQTNSYLRKEFTVPAAGQEFFRVQAVMTNN